MSSQFGKNLSRFKQLVDSPQGRHDENLIWVVWAQGRVFISTDGGSVGPKIKAELKGTVYTLTGIKPEEQTVGFVVSVDTDKKYLNVRTYAPEGVSAQNGDPPDDRERTRETPRNLLIEEKDIVWVG